MAAKSTLYYVAPLQIDAPSPTLRFNISSHAGNSLELAVLVGGSYVTTITGFNYTNSNQGSISIALTSAQITAIQNAMVRMASTTATYLLITNPNLGSSTNYATISTSAEYSSPSFASISLSEQNATVASLLSGAGYLQNLSSLFVGLDGLTFKNGALIGGVDVTIGNKTVHGSSNTFTFGSIPASGELTVTATLYDTRGYSYTKTETITVFPYQQISIDNYSLKRENNVEDTIQLSFEGAFSPVEVEGTALNTFQGAVYRYKKTTDINYSADATISGITSDDDSFSFSDSSWISLSNDYAYDIQIDVSDTLATTTLTLQVSQGKPAMSIRKLGVGFGKANPQCAVDASGEIRMNEYGVMGSVMPEMSDSVDLDDITYQGLYMRFTSGSTTANHYPTSSVRGVLEVFEAVGVSTVLQRFTDMDNAKIYTRVYDGSSWTSWTQI